MLATLPPEEVLVELYAVPIEELGCGRLFICELLKNYKMPPTPTRFTLRESAENWMRKLCSIFKIFIECSAEGLLRVGFLAVMQPSLLPNGEHAEMFFEVLREMLVTLLKLPDDKVLAYISKLKQSSSAANMLNYKVVKLADLPQQTDDVKEKAAALNNFNPHKLFLDDKYYNLRKESQLIKSHLEAARTVSDHVKKFAHNSRSPNVAEIYKLWPSEVLQVFLNVNILDFGSLPDGNIINLENLFKPQRPRIKQSSKTKTLQQLASELHTQLDAVQQLFQQPNASNLEKAATLLKTDSAAIFLESRLLSATGCHSASFFVSEQHASILTVGVRLVFYIPTTLPISGSDYAVLSVVVRHAFSDLLNAKMCAAAVAFVDFFDVQTISPQNQSMRQLARRGDQKLATLLDCYIYAQFGHFLNYTDIMRAASNNQQDELLKTLRELNAMPTSGSVAECMKLYRSKMFS